MHSGLCTWFTQYTCAGVDCGFVCQTVPMYVSVTVPSMYTQVCKCDHAHYIHPQVCKCDCA